MIYFITGNKNKFKEVQLIIKDIEQLDINLPEIQELDAHEIIKSKLHDAFSHTQGEFIVEDTSLYLDCLNGFPGPLNKWLLKAVGNEGIANLAEKLGNTKAHAKTLIGYAKNDQEIHFFEGVINGTIVSPQGTSDFGWEPIFLPDEHTKTFAQMPLEEKNEISMRRHAVNKLVEFLKTN